jgi:hypothetical protein
MGAMGNLHRWSMGIGIYRDHLDPKAHCLYGNLSAQLARTQQ